MTAPRPPLNGTCHRTLAVALFLVLSSACLRGAEPSYPRETWLGMYLGKAKLGYTVIRLDKTDYKGARVLKTESTSRTEMTVMGAKMVQDIRTVIYSDDTTRPVYEEFKMSSGGKNTEVFADFLKDKIACRIVTDSGQSTKDIPIPAGTQLVGDTYTPGGGEKLAVGSRYERKAFNPLTLTLDDTVVTVDREETLQIGGKPVKAVVIVTKTPLANLTTYQSRDDDEVLKIEAPMGITMIREPKDVAMSLSGGEYRPPQDFAVLTSVRTDVDLPSKGPVKKLQIRLSGIPDKSFILSDARQRVDAITGEDSKSATYLIVASTFDPASSSSLPVKGEQWEAYLSSSPYLDADSPSVQSSARSVVGDEKNIYKAAQKISRWVNGRMKPQSDMGILRPASDVLKNPQGVCRDYAVLFAAVARAAGIPTRIAGGLVLTRGDFYYHAWNEVWTGRAWTPLDSTASDGSVDATHIKLTEGDATDMFKMGKIIGQLRAEVLGYD